MLGLEAEFGLNKIYCMSLYVCIYIYTYLEIKIVLLFGLDPSGQMITNSLDGTSRNTPAIPGIAILWKEWQKLEQTAYYV